MSITVVLIRHAESGKNIKKSFSSPEMDNSEILTVNGINQATSIGDSIQLYCNKKNIKKISVYSAKSLRSMQTAEIISKKLNCQVHAIDGVQSFNFGTNAGKKEIDVMNEQCEFYHRLTLYRKGIINSYDIVYEGSKETLKEYERHVYENINNHIAKAENNSLSLFVIHRSALTAYLLFLARKHFNYPKDFYGYIQLDLGNVCIFEIEDEKVKHFDINISTKEFEKLL
jgi:broad specificity phosphatase PhoE